MNGQTDINFADTELSVPVRYGRDTIHSLPDSVGVSLPADSSQIAVKYTVDDIFGKSVKAHAESGEYHKSKHKAEYLLSASDVSVILVVIVSWLWIMNRYGSETGKIIKGILFPSLIRQVYETAGIHMRRCLRMTYNFTLLLSYAVLAYLARTGFLRIPRIDMNIYLYILAVLAAFVSVRYLLSAFMTKMIADPDFKKVRSYNNIYVSAAFFALAPLTALLYISFAGSIFSYVLLALIASLLIGYYVFVFRIFYLEKLTFNRIILYLCTVEIVPLAFAVYLIFWE